MRYWEPEKETEEGGVQDNGDDLFSIDRYSPARGAAHIESEKCRKRPKAEECFPDHNHEEEFLILRANALPDPYRTVSVTPKRTSTKGHERTYKDNGDQILTHTKVPAHKGLPHEPSKTHISQNKQRRTVSQVMQCCARGGLLIPHDLQYLCGSHCAVIARAEIGRAHV